MTESVPTMKKPSGAFRRKWLAFKKYVTVEKLVVLVVAGLMGGFGGASWSQFTKVEQAPEPVAKIAPADSIRTIIENRTTTNSTVYYYPAPDPVYENCRKYHEEHSCT